MRSSFRKNRGLGLMELLIGVSVGMMVTYFVMNIMVTSNRSANQSNSAAQSQETGRFILHWLTKEIHRAGYTPNEQEGRTTPMAPLCGGAAMPPAAGAACSFESTDLSDRLALRRLYRGATTPRDAQDCMGVNLALADDTPLVDVYWIEPNFAGAGADDNFNDVFRCVTYNENTGTVVALAQTLAVGVENMQILYGERDATGRRYVSADQVNNWNNVHAVKLSILTRSFADQAQRAQQRSFVLLDATPLTFNDTIARQIQLTTVFLTNED